MVQYLVIVVPLFLFTLSNRKKGCIYRLSACVIFSSLWYKYFLSYANWRMQMEFSKQIEVFFCFF